MIGRLALLCCLAGPAMAEVSYPALHDVAGVAAGDMLNVRTEPDAGSPTIGSLSPDLSGVEVVAVSPDGKWGRVNLGETSGWAALKFLRPQDNPPWWAMARGLQCGGTEPFWSLSLDPDGRQITLSSPEAGTTMMDISALWPGQPGQPVVVAQFAGMGQAGVALVRAELATDGMSDRIYGLSLNLFLTAPDGTAQPALRGFCALAP